MFVPYIHSTYLMKDKEVYEVSRLPIPKYGLSLALAVVPQVRFLQQMQKRPTKELLMSSDNKVIVSRTVPSPMMKWKNLELISVKKFPSFRKVRKDQKGQSPDWLVALGMKGKNRR